MNKVAKILSAVISVTVALSIALVMLTTALAAETVKFSLNLVEETADTVVVSVKLDEGSFGAFGFHLEYDDAKIAQCTKIVKTFEMYVETNTANCYASGATSDGYSNTEAPIATYTLEKATDADITADDITLVIDNCASVDTKDVETVVINNLPVAEAPSEPSETPSEPSETPSEPSETPSEPSETPSEPSETPSEPSETPSEPSETPSEPSETPSEPSETPSEPSETPSEPSETPSEPSTDAPSEDKTDAPVADDNTTAPEAGDVVNPDTGDSVTASAAIVSLLAVSGAAIVALRKKED